MKKSKWPDFIFTIVVRFIGGLLIGGLASLLVSYRGVLRAFSHDNPRLPLIWLSVCALIGGFIGVFTVPRWQTPWYKGIHDKDNER